MKQAPHPLRLQEGAEGEAARVYDILISTRASFYKILAVNSKLFESVIGVLWTSQLLS